jgi:hypothetical protein
MGLNFLESFNNGPRPGEANTLNGKAGFCPHAA